MARRIRIFHPETALNSEVTDSIVQPGTEVTGLAPATAEGIYYEVNAQALGLAALNATQAQMQNLLTAQSATPVEITQMYSLPVATDPGGGRHQGPRLQRKKRIH